MKEDQIVGTEEVQLWAADLEVKVGKRRAVKWCGHFMAGRGSSTSSTNSRLSGPARGNIRQQFGTD